MQLNCITLLRLLLYWPLGTLPRAPALTAATTTTAAAAASRENRREQKQRSFFEPHSRFGDNVLGIRVTVSPRRECGSKKVF